MGRKWFPPGENPPLKLSIPAIYQHTIFSLIFGRAKGNLCKPLRWDAAPGSNVIRRWERGDCHSGNFSGRGPSGFTILPIVLSGRRRPGKPGSWAGAAWLAPAPSLKGNYIFASLNYLLWGRGFPAQGKPTIARGLCH